MDDGMLFTFVIFLNNANQFN